MALQRSTHSVLTSCYGSTLLHKMLSVAGMFLIAVIAITQGWQISLYLEHIEEAHAACCDEVVRYDANDVKEEPCLHTNKDEARQHSALK